MGLTTSSDVARRMLAARLQQLRRAAGLTQTATAHALGCSQGQIAHLEGERTPPSPELLAAAAQLYNASDQLSELQDLLSVTLQNDWWQTADLTADPTGFAAHIGLFSGASHASIWELRLIPGILQTADYARTVLSASLYPQDLDDKVDVRLRRQEAVTRTDNPVPLQVVLDESALRRPIATPYIMREQFQHLLTLADLPNVSLQVCPASVGAHPGLVGPFEQLHFPHNHDGVVVLESRVQTFWLQGEYSMQHYEQVMDHLCQIALSPNDSASLITALRTELAR